jgi:hypothetical protein
VSTRPGTPARWLAIPAGGTGKALKPGTRQSLGFLSRDNWGWGLPLAGGRSGQVG